MSINQSVSVAYRHFHFGEKLLIHIDANHGQMYDPLSVPVVAAIGGSQCGLRTVVRDNDRYMVYRMSVGYLGNTI